MYKYELHMHCSEVSLCGRSTAEEMVQAFFDVGYAGVVLTDHFIHGNTAIDRSLPWSERMKTQFSSYKAAIKLGKKLGIDVFIGLEHNYGNGKEVLVYGDISLEILLEHPEINDMTIYEFAAFCHSNGWFVAQAHPYRERGYIDMSIQPIPEILDGVEVYNFCNKPEENIKAVEFCEKYSLVPISGSDTHSKDMCGKAGMAFEKRLNSGKELAEALFKKQGRLIVEGEIC